GVELGVGEEIHLVEAAGEALHHFLHLLPLLVGNVVVDPAQKLRRVGWQVEVGHCLRYGVAAHIKQQLPEPVVAFLSLPVFHDVAAAGPHVLSGKLHRAGVGCKGFAKAVVGDPVLFPILAPKWVVDCSTRGRPWCSGQPRWPDARAGPPALSKRASCRSALGSRGAAAGGRPRQTRAGAALRRRRLVAARQPDKPAAGRKRGYSGGAEWSVA
nr:hypothetical protein [Tanacetum cinerariifolium]